MTTNTAYKPSEGKREEFRKYLEKNGIMDALTKVLVNLYEEVDKPEDALMYIIDKLALQAGLETNKTLTCKIEEQQARIAELEDQLQQLRNVEAASAAEFREEAMEPPPEEVAPEMPIEEPPPE